MLERIHDYFVPKDLIRKRSSSDFESISEIAKSKLVVSLVLLLFFTVLPSFSYRFFILEHASISLMLILITPFVFLALLFQLKKSGSYKVTIWVIFITFLTVMPFRLYHTGGIQSANLSWYLAGAVIVSILHTRRNSLIYYFISICQLGIIYALPPVTPNANITLQLFIHLTSFCAITTSIISLLKMKESIIKKSQILEQNKTINLMITSLSHEINNPLSIGMGYLEQLEKDLEDPRIEKVQKALSRINNIVKKISYIELSDEKQVEVENYTNSEQILNLNKK